MARHCARAERGLGLIKRRLQMVDRDGEVPKDLFERGVRSVFHRHAPSWDRARRPGGGLGALLLLGEFVVGEIDDSIEVERQVGGEVP